MTREQQVWLSEFMDGFARGANQLRGPRRHVLSQDPELHRRWRQGFEAGRDAARRAMEEFKRELLQASVVAPTAVSP